MTVYVQSNFVLEVALRQEQHRSCLELIRLSEKGEIRLAVPAFSLVEPYETVVRRSKRRHSVADQVTAELRELGRSAPYTKKAGASEDLTAILVESLEDEKVRLRETIEILLRSAEVIPLTPEIVTAAIEHQSTGWIQAGDHRPDGSRAPTKPPSSLTVTFRPNRCNLFQS